MEGNLGGDGERTVLNKIQYMKLSELIKAHFKSLHYVFCCYQVILSSGLNFIRITWDFLEKSTFKKVLACKKAATRYVQP